MQRKWRLPVKTKALSCSVIVVKTPQGTVKQKLFDEIKDTGCAYISSSNDCIISHYLHLSSPSVCFLSHWEIAPCCKLVRMKQQQQGGLD